MIVSILGSLLAIFIVVFIHELGHFVAARLLKVKILKFSVGFGPTLWSYTSKTTKTVYALSAIPLGGYLKMYGEEEDDSGVLRADLSYTRKPVWVRMIISLAGPFANMLLASVLFSVVALLGITHIKPIVGSVIPYSMVAQAGIKKGDQLIQIGSKKIYGWNQVILLFLLHVGDVKPLLVVTTQNSYVRKNYVDLSNWRIDKQDTDIIQALGFVPYRLQVPPIIQEVMKGAPAALAGMREGDRICKINGLPISDWSQVLNVIHQLPNKEATIVVARDGIQKSLIVHVTHYIGIIVKQPLLPDSMVQMIHASFWSSIKIGIAHTWDLFFLNLSILGKLFTGHVSLNTLSGPISVFQTAKEASQAGIIIYVRFIGFISVALGFINLLPIPVLDGGHVFFQIIEAVIRRPLPRHYQLIGMKLGLFFLLCLMLQATVNDVLRLI